MTVIDQWLQSNSTKQTDQRIDDLKQLQFFLQTAEEC